MIQVQEGMVKVFHSTESYLKKKHQLVHTQVTVITESRQPIGKKHLKGTVHIHVILCWLHTFVW